MIDEPAAVIVLAIPFLIMGSFIYFFLICKNDFEKRVAQYIPQGALPQRRKAYIDQQIRLQKRYRWGFLAGAIAAVAFCVYLNHQEGTPFTFDSNLLLLFVAVMLPFFALTYYYFTAIAKRNIKAQEMLLKAMNDDDFALFEKIKNLSSSYNTPVMVCEGKLYFFFNYAIKEFDMAKIRWSSLSEPKYNLVKLSVLQPEGKRIGEATVPTEVGTLLKELIEQYRPYDDEEDDDEELDNEA